MKKIGILALAVISLTACSSDDEQRVFNVENETNVTLTFSPYTMVETRAATSIANVVTKLDVWIYESGNETEVVHQSSGDAGFGTFSVTLDKTKTYTLYAVGHKGSDAATLANGIIYFPDDKVTESMFFTTSFSPATTTSLSCLMKRIVGKFILQSTDELPAYADHVKLTIYNTATRYNVDGTLTNVIDREVSFPSLSTKDDGTISFATNILSVDDVTTNFNIRIQVFDNTDTERQNRLFEDVPIRNNFRTTYRGIVFRDVEIDDISFTVDDWQDYNVVNF